MDLGFKSNPNMHRAQEWPISSADRSRANVGGAGQDFWEDLRDANQFMFCGTAIPRSERHRQRKRGLGMRDDWVGISRSTDFVIIVPGPFWRKVFLQKWASCKKGSTTEGNTL